MGSTESWTSKELLNMFYNDNNGSFSTNPTSVLEYDNQPQRSENDDTDIFNNRNIGDEVVDSSIMPPNFHNMSNNNQVNYGTSSNVAIDANNNGEPAEIIVSRVVFALLISISLVLNLLLILAVK